MQVAFVARFTRHSKVFDRDQSPEGLGDGLLGAVGRIWVF